VAGVGTPTGFHGIPVIMITGNPRIFERMKENIDINAGAILTGEKSLQQVGEEIYQEIITVASGKLSDALNNQFAAYSI
jgi:altronate dehydratase large subunit